MKTFSFSLCFGAIFILSACAWQKNTSVPGVPFRDITQEELQSFIEPGFQLMPQKADTANVFHANIDRDNDEEVLMILNSDKGCNTTDRARLIALKFDHSKNIWSRLQTIMLVGRQGRIESFQSKPTDITGDGLPDVEIVSETNGCGAPWTVYKQLFNFHGAEVVDLTGGIVSSLEGGVGLIKRIGTTYEVYARVGQEWNCNPYSLTFYDFDGRKFVQGKTLTSTYKYKTKFDVTGNKGPDMFSDGCVTVSNDNAKKLSYIREDAVNHHYPSVVTQ